MKNVTTLYESPWIGLYRIGHWDFVRRPNSTACVGILPITADNEIILVSQFRIPVQKTVIEIPAGLVGDEPEFQSETLAQTASRELLEETGYRAGKIEALLVSPTSAGMTSEFTHLFIATGLVKISEGGGTENEAITVHKVQIQNLRQFLTEKHQLGNAIDFKIHAALAAAGIHF